MKTPKLYVELVPRTCWFTNVRSQVSAQDWDWLRKETYKSANYQCECCEAKGKMEAHEIWHYDDKNKIQKLAGITCLCHYCHQAYHLGYASTQPNYPQIKKHLAKVNGWNSEETEFFISAIFETYYYRSQHQWTLDLSLLDTCNIVYNKIKPNERYRKLIK